MTSDLCYVLTPKNPKKVNLKYYYAGLWSIIVATWLHPPSESIPLIDSGLLPEK